MEMLPPINNVDDVVSVSITGLDLDTANDVIFKTVMGNIRRLRFLVRRLRFQQPVTISGFDHRWRKLFTLGNRKQLSNASVPGKEGLLTYLVAEDSRGQRAGFKLEVVDEPVAESVSKVKSQNNQFHAVVRVSIAGLDEQAAIEAIQKAHEEAFSRLRIPTRRFVAPTTLRYMDSKGRTQAAISDFSHYVADASSPQMSEPENVFFIVVEDSRGRKARVRIEIVR
jgi:hypothetical protein